MIVSCPNCHARFVADDALFPPRGRRVRCSSCGKAWFQPGPAAVGSAAGSAAASLSGSPAGGAAAVGGREEAPAPPGAQRAAGEGLGGLLGGGRLAAFAFAGLGAVVTILAGAYAFAPQLAARVPALAPSLESYRSVLGFGAGALGGGESGSFESRLFSVVDPVYSYEDPPEAEIAGAGAPRFVIISASLVNMDDRQRPAPRLKATLRDSQGALAAEAFIGPMERKSVLNPRESALYFLRIPLREKQEVEVTLRAVPGA